jgi:uncharacterized membrane protein YdbT with pleckstrin-like domain
LFVGVVRGGESPARTVCPALASGMAFPTKYLNENEAIVLERKPHLWFLVGPLGLVFGSIVLGVIAGNFINPKGDANGYVTWATLVVPVIATIWLVAKWVQWTNTNFVLTTDRLIYRHGVFSKKGMEIPLERVNNISSSQTFSERILGAGDLLIESGGEGGQQRFSNVKRPFEVQNKIYQEIERTKARDMDRMAGRRELSVAEQIEKLGDLVQKGLLTQAEFDAKKSQLLDKI